METMSGYSFSDDYIGGKLFMDGQEIEGNWSIRTGIKNGMFALVALYQQKQLLSKKKLIAELIYMSDDYLNLLKRENPKAKSKSSRITNLVFSKAKGIKGLSGFFTLEIAFMEEGKQHYLEFCDIWPKDQEKFSQAWEYYLDQANNIQSASCRVYDTLIRDKCRTEGSVDIVQFINQYGSDLQLIDASQSEFHGKENWITDLENIITGYIERGYLNGLLDREKHTYTDRSLLVRTQRIINIEVDFNSILQQLGNKGINLQAIQCPQCGHSCDIPASGSTFTCPACSTAIKATDIFEKFKGFLS